MNGLIQFNIANNMIIFINNYQEQVSRATKIQEQYSVLQQNIDTDVYDSSKVSEVVNSIIVDFKYLYDENFRNIVYNDNHRVKCTLETGLGLLKVFKGYQKEKLINDKVFNSFNDFLNAKIDLLTIPNNKNSMYEEICIYEILKSNSLSIKVYGYEGAKIYGFSDDYIFDKTIRDKFCSIHFQKVLDTLHREKAINPKTVNELYLSLIKQYNEILNIEDNKEQILLGNS